MFARHGLGQAWPVTRIGKLEYDFGIAILLLRLSQLFGCSRPVRRVQGVHWPSLAHHSLCLQCIPCVIKNHIHETAVSARIITRHT
jgi:hypothetical protein